MAFLDQQNAAGFSNAELETENSLCVQSSPPTDPTLSLINLARILPFQLFKDSL